MYEKRGTSSARRQKTRLFQPVIMIARQMTGNLMRLEEPRTEHRFAPGQIVCVIDDDGDLRRSLHFLLGTRDICVSPYPSGVQFLRELDSLKPAPILLDIRMPEMDGTQVLHELASRGISWPVIMLSGHGEIGLAVQSLKAGAIDFLEKPVSAKELLGAIETAFQHLAKRVAAQDTRGDAAGRLDQLTPREVEVLDLLCEGRSNKQVAFTLSISPRTVEMHRANALRQLNVRSLVEAAAVRTAAAI
jgi:two-component system response regulator FixJ